MVTVKKRFLVTLNAPNSSTIDASRIIDGDAILSAVLRLPANKLPNANDFPGGFGKGTKPLFPQSPNFVGPRDVGFPIQVNSGPAVPEGSGGTTGTGTTGGDTGNPADALGRIILVQAPTFTTSGGQFQIKIHVRNDGSATAKFQSRVEIASLGIVNEPTAGVVLKPLETGIINKTMIMPTTATSQLYPATIELLKVINITTGEIVKEDEEISTIPGPNVTVPPTPTPGGDCIIRNGLEYCKANQFITGCIIENGVVYCPSSNTCPPGHILVNGVCVPDQQDCPTGSVKVNGICIPDIPPGTAAIQMPSSVRDGDSFNVAGSGFAPGERVEIRLTITWQSSKPKYNGRIYNLSRSEDANSGGTWIEQMKTEEVSSGVEGIAQVTATGTISGRVAVGSIRVL